LQIVDKRVEPAADPTVSALRLRRPDPSVGRADPQRAQLGTLGSRLVRELVWAWRGGDPRSRGGRKILGDPRAGRGAMMRWRRRLPHGHDREAEHGQVTFDVMDTPRLPPALDAHPVVSLAAVRLLPAIKDGVDVRTIGDVQRQVRIEFLLMP